MLKFIYLLTVLNKF